MEKKEKKEEIKNYKLKKKNKHTQTWADKKTKGKGQTRRCSLQQRGE